MKKWTTILMILCIGVTMILVSGCEKKQLEQEVETMNVTADTVVVEMDSTAVTADSVAVEMEEIVE